MIPAAFVVGVITTLLAALTVVSMKGLGIGVRIEYPQMFVMSVNVLFIDTCAGHSAHYYRWPNAGKDSARCDTGGLIGCSISGTRSSAISALCERKLATLIGRIAGKHLVNSAHSKCISW